MRWWRRHVNGEAKRAIAEAQEQHRAATQKSTDVDRTTRAAEQLTRRVDRFTREIERSWHLRRGAT